jgi:hypothetical protein
MHVRVWGTGEPGFSLPYIIHGCTLSFRSPQERALADHPCWRAQSDRL